MTQIEVLDTIDQLLNKVPDVPYSMWLSINLCMYDIVGNTIGRDLDLDYIIRNPPHSKNLIVLIVLYQHAVSHYPEVQASTCFGDHRYVLRIL